MYDKVILKRISRLNAGHLWVFSNEIKTDFRNISPGGLTDVYDAKNNYLGTGYFNPNVCWNIRYTYTTFAARKPFLAFDSKSNCWIFYVWFKD
jgi:23S rRNA G2069 N7-methylase RlmK/C1962 C5-methylase RlmI